MENKTRVNTGAPHKEPVTTHKTWGCAEPTHKDALARCSRRILRRVFTRSRKKIVLCTLKKQSSRSSDGRSTQSENLLKKQKGEANQGNKKKTSKNLQEFNLDNISCSIILFAAEKKVKIWLHLWFSIKLLRERKTSCQVNINTLAARLRSQTSPGAGSIFEELI